MNTAVQYTVNNIPRVKLDLSMLGAEVTSLSLSNKNAQEMFTPPAHIALRGPFTHKARHTGHNGAALLTEGVVLAGLVGRTEHLGQSEVRDLN
jgi:hypothetical protein